MDREKKEYIRAWLQKAEHDMKNVSIIIGSEDNEKPFDTVCFHCQQAVEKYLKAYLVYLDVMFPKTHNIAQLIALGAKTDKNLQNYLKAEELSPYGIDIRYPDDFYLPTYDEAMDAYHIALDLKKYIKKAIKLKKCE